MKAKRIADIKANIADLKKQISMLLDAQKKQRSEERAPSFTAQAIIAAHIEMLSTELSLAINTLEKKGHSHAELMTTNAKYAKTLTQLKNTS